MSEAVMLDRRYERIEITSGLPGSVSTGLGESGKAGWKIAPADVADDVAMVLSMPETALVNHVEIRPSKPPK